MQLKRNSALQHYLVLGALSLTKLTTISLITISDGVVETRGHDRHELVGWTVIWERPEFAPSDGSDNIGECVACATMRRDSWAAPTCTTSGSHLLAVVRSTGEGKITLTASADECEAQSVTIITTGVLGG